MLAPVPFVWVSRTQTFPSCSRASSATYSRLSSVGSRSVTVPDDFEPLDTSAFSERIGPLYISRRESVPVIGLLVDDHHLNRTGRIHGGLLATVADIAVSRAAWDQVPDGATIATADLHIAYLGNVNAGAWVEAWPSVDRVGRAVVHASCLVESDGEPLAKVLATVAVRLPAVAP